MHTDSNSSHLTEECTRVILTVGNHLVRWIAPPSVLCRAYHFVGGSAVDCQDSVAGSVGYAPCWRERRAMALAALSGDEQRTIFSQLCNVLDPGFAVAFSSASSELRALTRSAGSQDREERQFGLQ